LRKFVAFFLNMATDYRNNAFMPQDDDLSIIDWTNVFEEFCRQENDLFSFLGQVHVEGRTLTEEERTQAFCEILCNEQWADSLTQSFPFPMAVSGTWEYAVVKPPALLRR
jgi:hypothetical protein